MPVWGRNVEAGGIEMRHIYGEDFVIQDTNNRTPTWRGVDAYYGVAVTTVGPNDGGYRGVRDQNWTMGPDATLVDDVLVGSPSGMFDTEAYVYGTFGDAVALFYDGVNLGNAKLLALVNSLEDVYFLPDWIVGTVLMGAADTITLAQWVAERMTDPDVPSSTVTPPTAWPYPANRYASWIFAFRPDPNATLGVWQDLLTAEGTTSAQRFIWFQYRLVA